MDKRELNNTKKQIYKYLKEEILEGYKELNINTTEAPPVVLSGNADEVTNEFGEITIHKK